MGTAERAGRARRHSLLFGVHVLAVLRLASREDHRTRTHPTEAIEKMRAALDGFEVAGVPTTIPFHRQVLTHEDFRSARVTTRWVEEKFLPQRHTQLPQAPAQSRIGVGQ